MKTGNIIILITLSLILIGGIIAAYIFIPSKTTYQNTYSPTWTQENLNSLEIDEGVVGYTLAQFEVYKLRSIPLTKNTPKIEVMIDGDNYIVEIKNGNIITTQGSTDEEDLIISMNRENVIDILNESNDAISEIQEAINEGTISVEIIAGKPELLIKGYLELYGELTVENLEDEE